MRLYVFCVLQLIVSQAAADDALGTGSVVFVETRDVRLDDLIFVVTSSMAFLPAHWPIILHVPLAFSPELRKSAAMVRLLESGRMTIVHRFVPHGHNFTRELYSNLLATPRFWADGASGCHVLVAQTDSCFCAGSDSRLEEYLVYDYIGAPWPHAVEEGIGYVWGRPHAGNGGFSLRRRAAMIALTRTFPRAPGVAEDVYVQLYGSKLNFSYAPTEVAARFSSEQVLLHPRPLAGHQAHRLLHGDHLAAFLKVCPHARILS